MCCTDLCFALWELLEEVIHGFLHVLCQCLIAFLLVRDLHDGLELLGGLGLHGSEDIFSKRWEQLELASLCVHGFCQRTLRLAQGGNEWLRRFNTFGYNSLGGRRSTFSDALHHVVGRAGFHHHHGDVGLLGALSATATAAGRLRISHTSSNHQLKDRLALLLVGWEGDPLAFGVLGVGNKGHTNAANRAGDREAGQLRGGGGRVDGDHVIHVLGVQGHHGYDDLDLVAQALDEGWAQRTVDLTSSQDRISTGATFAAEEATGNATGGVHALFHIHGQWEEVDALARVAGGGGGGQEHRVFVQVRGDGSIGLTSQQAGLKTDGAGAEIAIVDGGDGFPDSCVRVNKFCFDFLCAHSDSCNRLSFAFASPHQNS